MSRDFIIPTLKFSPLLAIDVAEYFLKPLILNIPVGSEPTDNSNMPMSRLNSRLLNNIELSGFERKFNSSLNEIEVVEKTIVIEEGLIALSCDAKITETYCEGRNLSVVESFGFNNYSIQISGKIVGAYGKYPIDEVNKLKDICNLNSELNISNPYLNSIGIQNILIESSNIPQNEGQYSQQYFEITAMSFTKQINLIQR